MAQKMSVRRLIGTAAALSIALIGLAGCSNAPASKTPVVVHASSSPSPAALASALSEVVSATLDGDFIETTVDGKSSPVSQIGHAKTPISGLSFVAYEIAAKSISPATAADAASFKRAHPTVMDDLSAQLAGGNCTKVLSTKAGYLAVCTGGTYDVAVENSKVTRVYKTAKDASGTRSHVQYLVSAGWSTELKKLFAAGASL